ncbi:MAG: hypothetical protein JST92_01550, partial [Deltaproteobacteria bacterium]|nr:hypothetical protein [Deltaproteobacteria bacterium]
MIAKQEQISSRRTRSHTLPVCLALGLLACTTRFLPPTAAFDAPATAHVGVAVQLDGTKSAPAPRDGEPAPVLAFAWTFDAKPAGSTAAFTNANAVAPRFTPDVAGDYVVRLVVADFAHKSAPLVKLVTAAADCVPQAQIALSSASVAAGQPVTMTATAISPCDGAAGHDPIASLKWTLEVRPDESRAQLVGAERPQASLTPDVRGHYEVSLVATDALGNHSASTLRASIDALSCGDNAPVARAISIQPPAPHTGEALLLAGTVTDADTAAPCSLQRTITDHWRILGAPLGSHAQLNSVTARTPSFTVDVPGTYSLSLTASDELGRTSAPVTASIDVSTCGAGTPIAQITAPS